MAEIKWTNVNDAGANAAMGNYLDAQKQLQYQVGNIGNSLQEFTNVMNKGQREVGRKIINDNTDRAINEMLQINDTQGYEAYKQSGAGLADNVLARFGGMVDLGRFNEARANLEKGVLTRAQSIDNSKDYTQQARDLQNRFAIAQSTNDIGSMQNILKEAQSVGVSLDAMTAMGNTSQKTFGIERDNRYNVAEIQGNHSQALNQAKSAVQQAIAEKQAAIEKYPNKDLRNWEQNFENSIEGQALNQKIQLAQAQYQSTVTGMNEQRRTLGLDLINTNSEPSAVNQVLNRTNTITGSNTQSIPQQQGTVPQSTNQQVQPQVDMNQVNQASNTTEQLRLLRNGLGSVDGAENQRNENVGSMNVYNNTNSEGFNTLVNKINNSGVRSLNQDELSLTNQYATNFYQGIYSPEEAAQLGAEFAQVLAARQQTAINEKGKPVVLNAKEIEEEDNRLISQTKNVVLNEMFPTQTVDENNNRTINLDNVAVRANATTNTVGSIKKLTDLISPQSEKEGWKDSLTWFGMTPRLKKAMNEHVGKFLKLDKKYQDRINPEILINIYNELATEFNGGIASDGELTDNFYNNVEAAVNKIVQNPDLFIQKQDEYLKQSKSLDKEFQNPVMRAHLVVQAQRFADGNGMVSIPEQHIPKLLQTIGRTRSDNTNKQKSAELRESALKYLRTPSSSFVSDWEKRNGSTKKDEKLVQGYWGAANIDKNVGNRGKLQSDWNSLISNKLSPEQTEYLRNILPQLTKADQDKLLDELLGKK